jgi:hypothetical protein
MGSVRVEKKGDPTRGQGQSYRSRPTLDRESTGGVSHEALEAVFGYGAVVAASYADS